eukprot:scaffold57725_cov31-Tisochrysis_lutea.AAC.2
MEADKPSNQSGQQDSLARCAANVASGDAPLGGHSRARRRTGFCQHDSLLFCDSALPLYVPSPRVNIAINCKH